MSIAPAHPYQHSLGELADIETISLPEATSASEFTADLERVVASDLPGFIIRQTAWHGSPATNKALAELMLATLEELGAPFISDTQIENVTIQATRGEGRLHLDNYKDMSVETINGHTTITGSGAVHIAESGPSAVNLLRDGRLRNLYSSAIREQFRNGKVYPNVMSFEVYTGYVRAGDHVVFPLSNQHGPVWHRFDTDSPTRSADAWFLDRQE